MGLRVSFDVYYGFKLGMALSPSKRTNANWSPTFIN